MTPELTPEREIQSLYADVLGRQADTGGLDYWTGQLSSGTPIEDIRQSFMSSPEYVQRMESMNAPQTPSYPLDYLSTNTPETVLVNPSNVNYPTVDSGYGFLNPPEVAPQMPYFPSTERITPSMAEWAERFTPEQNFTGEIPNDVYANSYKSWVGQFQSQPKPYIPKPEVATQTPYFTNLPLDPSQGDYLRSLNPPDIAKLLPPPPVQSTFPQLPITVEPRSSIPPGFDTHLRDEYGNIIGYRDPARRTTPMPPMPSTAPIPAGYYLDENGNVLPITPRPSRVVPNPTGLGLLGTLFANRPR